MSRFWHFLPWFVAFSVVSGVVQATTLTSRQAAERLFQSTEIDPDSEQLAPVDWGVLDDLKERLGRFRHIERCADKCLALFENGEVRLDIAVDTEGRITQILFEVPIVYAASLQEAVERLSSLPGTVSLVITNNGEELENADAHRPMVVGSAFKLAVLKALDNLVGAGKLEWEQVVRIEDDWRSLPSGKLDSWPVGTPLTLHTLATLMISESDDTAADALIDIVTRSSVTSISPRNRPFLKTREMFLLRSTPMSAIRARYIGGSFDVRMAILGELENVAPPPLNDLVREPILEMEWLFSTRELCTLMDDLAELEVLQITPGVAGSWDWARTSYTAGRDFGVMNLTTGMLAEDGSLYCVSATWNNAVALDENAFRALYSSLLHQLHQLHQLH